jgi:zinc transport system substrate-binding protein
MQSRKAQFLKRGLGLFWVVWVVMVLAVFPPLGTAGSDPATTLKIYVVNYPLMYFAERIAGDNATVVFPAPASEDPAYWMPDARTVSDYQRADLILLNGANYAKWVKKVTLPQFRLVDTSAGFKDQYIETAEIVTHSHGPEGEHAHEAVAFTTWIDFDLAAKQARAIADALVRKKPDLRGALGENYAALEKDLMTLDRDIKEIVSKNQHQPLIASHPVYDYFARRYGLNMRSVHWEPDEIPGDEQWMDLHGILKDHPATWMIWEGDPLEASVETLKSMGINSLVFDPCGNVPEHGDFMSVMRQNIENLKMAFER